MNKKSFLIIGLATVILVVAIIILVSGAKKDSQTTKTPDNNVKSSQSADTPGVVKVIETNADGVQIETELDVVNPGKAIDSSEIAESSLAAIPLNEEAILKYGPNGLETKSIVANSGARIFLTFSASDDKQHVFSFSDPSMESVSVLFSQEEGDKSINFLAPGPGTYEYLIDGQEKGTLTVN